MGTDHDDIPLNALRAFCEVARDVHVSRAAARIGVSQSAVSRHLALLEAHMGAPLLERHDDNPLRAIVEFMASNGNICPPDWRGYRCF